MPKAFNITVSSTNVELDKEGRGEVSITISNALGRDLRGRAEIKPLGETGKDWLNFEKTGEPTDERMFDTKTTHNFTVKVAVPPGTPEGTYSFRVDAISLENPDELYDEGQTISMEVKKQEEPPKKKFPWWVIAVIAGVLVVVGVVIWLLWPDDGPTPPPPPPPVTEDCIGFDWSRAAVRLLNNRYKITVGSMSLLDFGGSKAEAAKALSIIKNYRMNKQCFVGRPGPSMEYFLVNDKSPVGPFGGEDCIGFNPQRIEAKKVNSRWKIMEGSHSILDFGSQEAEARKAYSIIRKHGFRNICFVGRPGPSMTYFRQ